MFKEEREESQFASSYDSPPSQRRAVVEAASKLPRHANIMLRLEVEFEREKSEELYAKVVQPLEESSKRYVIHFTSIPPEMRTWTGL